MKRASTINSNVVQYRDWVIQFLKNQVKLRDNILFEQKMIIERNRISNDISYKGLKEVDKVDQAQGTAEDLKTKLPPLSGPQRQYSPKSILKRPQVPRPQAYQSLQSRPGSYQKLPEMGKNRFGGLPGNNRFACRFFPLSEF